MANNWRVNNDLGVYINGYTGDDANSGLTRDLPKKTLAGGRGVASSSGRTNIYICGYFKNELFGSLATAYNVIADGFCIIEYYGATTYVFGGGAADVNLYGIKFVGINGSGYGIYYTISSNNYARYWNCYFEDCYFGYTSSVLNRCLAYNCYLALIYGGTLLNSVFINCYIQNVVVMTRCYFNAACYIYMSTSAVVTSLTYNIFHNSRFKGYNGTYYDNLAAFKVAYASTPASNINEDPLFNGVTKGDFSVQAASPCLDNAKNGGTPIANAILGIPFYWSNGTTGWTLTNCSVLGGNSLECSDATSSSIIKNADSPIDIGSIKTIRNLDYLGLLKFLVGDKANVPAINQYTAGQAGYNPKRLTFGLKWSETSLTEAQWNAKSWTEFEIKLMNFWTVAIGYLDNRNIIRYDGTYGDGHPSFDYTMLPQIGYIKGRYFLLKFVLRNDY